MKIRPREYSDKTVFLYAVIAACLLHLIALIFVLAFNNPVLENGFKELAVMELADYDPDGGTLGGGNGSESAPEEQPEQIEPVDVEEVPASEAEEPVIADQLISSSSEHAEELITEQKDEEKFVEPEIKVKPKSKTQKSKIKPDPQAVQPQGKGEVGAQQNSGSSAGSGSGGAGGGTGAGTSDMLKAYKAKIQKKLIRHRKYPPTARAKRLEGTVTVSFSIDRTGKLISANLVQSSGHTVLDDEVMALVKRVSPFPPIPKEIAGNSMHLTVPIQFQIR